MRGLFRNTNKMESSRQLEKGKNVIVLNILVFIGTDLFVRYDGTMVVHEVFKSVLLSFENTIFH